MMQTEAVPTSATTEPDMQSIAMRLRTVRARIAECARTSGRATEPLLVAVSKLKSVEDIQQAYDAGQRLFGENYAQEIMEKAVSLPTDIRWHFIGSLQSNKVKKLVKKSVDSEKLALALNDAVSSTGRPPLQVLIQVNTSDESQKGGVAQHEIHALADCITSRCPQLALRGLMTIGKIGATPLPYFQALAHCRAKLAAHMSVPEESLELSMGMSADYDVAIQAGATMVRVGSTIFGPRDTHVSKTKPEDEEHDDNAEEAKHEHK